MFSSSRLAYTAISFCEVDIVARRHSVPLKTMNHPAGKYEPLCVCNIPQIAPFRLFFFSFPHFSSSDRRDFTIRIIHHHYPITINRTTRSIVNATRYRYQNRI